MTGLDIVVAALTGVFGVLGALRGFVRETLTLAAWVVAVLAVKLGFAPVSALLAPRLGGAGTAAVAACVLLFGVTLLVGKLLASRLGAASRRSVLGPVDRVLGGGLGVCKGLILATLLFLVLAAATRLFSASGPAWMTEARSYPLLRATSSALADLSRGQERRDADNAVQP